MSEKSARRSSYSSIQSPAIQPGDFFGAKNTNYEEPCSSAASYEETEKRTFPYKNESFKYENSHKEGYDGGYNEEYYPEPHNDHSKNGKKDSYVYENGYEEKEDEEEKSEENEESKEESETETEKINNLTGVAQLLNKIRCEINGIPPKNAKPKERIVLDELGMVFRSKDKLPLCRIAEVQQRVVLADQQEAFDLPLLPNVPTDVRLVRKMVRQKMIRCKKCKNRFIEKNIYERHLRDRHRPEYDEYIREQEEEVELQRQEEMEANRIEELQTGGFIPPENEIDLPVYHVTENIPLPGENNGGIVPRFDSYGRIKQIKRPYKKKISPQCPFCDKRFRNEFSLKKHFAKKHEEMLEFQQCIKCYKCLENDEDMKAHLCELTYVCFECTPIRNLCTDIRLLNHRKKFHRGANSGFKCSFCNMKFLTPRKLRKHKKMAHVFTKTYQCHFCEEIFISEVGVMTHERTHTGIIKFECKVCDYRANRYIQMEDHNRNEHGYVCSICQEKVTEWADLKHHTLTSHGGYLATDHIASHVESPRLWLLYKGE